MPKAAAVKAVAAPSALRIFRVDAATWRALQDATKKIGLPLRKAVDDARANSMAKAAEYTRAKAEMDTAKDKAAAELAFKNSEIALNTANDATQKAARAAVEFRGLFTDLEMIWGKSEAGYGWQEFIIGVTAAQAAHFDAQVAALKLQATEIKDAGRTVSAFQLFGAQEPGFYQSAPADWKEINKGEYAFGELVPGGHFLFAGFDGTWAEIAATLAAKLGVK